MHPGFAAQAGLQGAQQANYAAMQQHLMQQQMQQQQQQPQQQMQMQQQPQQQMQMQQQPQQQQMQMQMQQAQQAQQMQAQQYMAAQQAAQMQQQGAGSSAQQQQMLQQQQQHLLQQQRQQMQQRQQQMQMQGGQAAGASDGVAGGAADERLVVLTTGGDGQEFVVRTLLGEFAVYSSNHGRKVFQKTTNPEVFLYFWDSRDGAHMEGWWFGKSVGGDEVWSHCPGTDLTPPKKGWRIPFAGPVRDTLEVHPVPAGQQHSLPGQQQGMPAQQQQGMQAQQQQGMQAQQQQAMQAQQQQGMQQQQHGMQAQQQQHGMHGQQRPQMNQQSLEAHRQEQERRRAAAEQAMRQQREKFKEQQVAMQRQREEAAEKMKAEQLAKQKEAEEKDMKLLEEMLFEIRNKIPVAEDLTEKAVARFGALDVTAEDLSVLKTTIEETEVIAKQASPVMSEVLQMINEKSVTARKLTSKRGREEGWAQLSQFKTQMQALSTKLGKLSLARKDYEARITAEKMAKEIIDKLAPAEVDVDRSQESVDKLLASESQEFVVEAQQCIEVATQKLQIAFRIIEQRQTSAEGIVAKHLDKLEQRARASQIKLNAQKGAVTEIVEKEKNVAKLKEVDERVSSAQEAVRKAEAALKTDEDAETEAMLSAVEACDGAILLAFREVVALKAGIATGIVEAKRITDGAGQKTLAILDEKMKSQGELAARLETLRTASEEAKRQAVLKELEGLVSKAETAAEGLLEATKIFSGPESVADMPHEKVKEAVANNAMYSKECDIAMKAAEEALKKRHLESKAVQGRKRATAPLSDDLPAFRKRFRCAETKVRKGKKLPEAAEKQLRILQAVEEVSAYLAMVEDKAQKAAAIAQRLSDGTAEGAESANEPQPEAAKVVIPKYGGKGGQPSPPKPARGPVHDAEVLLTEATSTLQEVLTKFKVQQQEADAEEIVMLSKRLQAAGQKVESAQVALKHGAEKDNARSMVKESELKVKELEDIGTQAARLGEPLLGDGDASKATSSASFEAFEKVAKAGHGASQRASGHLNTKKLASKRFSEDVYPFAIEELNKLLIRVVNASTAMEDLRQKVSEKKYAFLKVEATQKVDDVAEKIQACQKLVAELRASGSDGEQAKVEPKEMARRVADTAKAQADAADATAKVKVYILDLLKEMKIINTSEKDSEVITKLLERIWELEKALDELRTQVSDCEQSFVASRLRQGAADHVERVQEKLAAATKASEFFLSDQKGELNSVVALSLVLDLLRRHMKEASLTPQALFEKMGGEQTAFTNFVKGLLSNSSGCRANDDQVKLAFKMLAKDDSLISEGELVQQLQRGYLCMRPVPMTDSLVTKGSTEKLTVEAGDLLQGLAEPTRDEAAGLQRVFVRRIGDNAEGYVSFSGSKEVVFIEAYTPYGGRKRQVEAALTEASEALNAAFTFWKQKSEAIQKQEAGPLADAKGDLKQMRTNAGKAQESFSILRKRVDTAQQQFAGELEAELNRRQEAADIQEAATTISEAGSIVDGIVARAEEAAEAAEALAKDAEGAAKAMQVSVERMLEVKQSLEKSQTEITEAHSSVVGARLERIKGSKKQASGDVRKAMTKLKVKLGIPESRCKAAGLAISGVHGRLCAALRQAILAAMRPHLQQRGMTPHQLCAELRGSGKDISAEAFRSFLLALPNSGLTMPQVDLAINSILCSADRISIMSFKAYVQEYLKCAREVVLTATFDVTRPKAVRKLQYGELLEVLGDRAVEKISGMERARCRTMSDGVEGWLTISGNSGVSYVHEAPFPWYLCDASEPRPLNAERVRGGAAVAQVPCGDVVELLEGPMPEAASETLRVRGRAFKDGKAGWITKKITPDGIWAMEPVRCLSCKASTALTQEFDLRSKLPLVRKIEVGEVVEMLETEPTEDVERKVFRYKVRAMKDGKEGWATGRGLAGGATFLVETDAFHRCREPVTMEDDVKPGSRAIRDMAVGEVFQVMEPPRSHKPDAPPRARGRVFGGSAGELEGWFSPGDGLRPFSTRLRCTTPTPLYNDISAVDASAKSQSEAASGDSSAWTTQPVHQLKVDEAVDAIGAPIVSDSGSWMLQVRTATGTTGFATMRGSDGQIYLEES